MAVYASARESVDSDQSPDFILVDGKEMRYLSRYFKKFNEESFCLLLI